MCPILWRILIPAQSIVQYWSIATAHSFFLDGERDSAETKGNKSIDWFSSSNYSLTSTTTISMTSHALLIIWLKPLQTTMRCNMQAVTFARAQTAPANTAENTPAEKLVEGSAPAPGIICPTPHHNLQFTAKFSIQESSHNCSTIQNLP